MSCDGRERAKRHGAPVELRTRILSTSLDGAVLIGLRLRGNAEGAAEQIEVVDVGGADKMCSALNTSAR